MLNAKEWPVVPKKDRPRRLPVNYIVDATTTAALADIGWEVVDVRLADRAERFDLTTEGLQLGTIAPTESMLAGFEIEFKLRQKGNGPKDDDKNKGKDDIDSLFSFGKVTEK